MLDKITPELILQLIVQAGGLFVLAGFLYVFAAVLLPKFLETLERMQMQFSDIINAHDDKHAATILGVQGEMKANTRALTQLAAHIDLQAQNCGLARIRQHPRDGKGDF